MQKKHIVKNCSIYSLIALLLCGCSTADPTEPRQFNNNIPDTGNEIPDASNDGMETSGSLQDPVTILTWNVRRYFDTVCDSGFCDEGDFESTFSAGEFEFQATRIADAIRRENADILLLQELEKEVCIQEIGKKLEMDAHVFGETFFNASLDVGVLTRGTVTKSVTHRDQTTLTLSTGRTQKFAREFLEVHIALDGREVIVFNAHFKSKNNDDPAWRLAEAEAAAEIVARVGKENPDALVVFGGDLNDTPGSAPINALDDELNRVSTNDTWTYAFGKQAIDHLLFYESGNVDVVPSSVEAILDNTGFGLSVSDHGALKATFGFTE